MKRKRKDFDIFNLSFLDVISCGFGAVVLLVLISNSGNDSLRTLVDEVEDIRHQALDLSAQIAVLKQDIDLEKKMKTVSMTESSGLEREVQSLEQELLIKEQQEKILTDDLAGLSLVQTSLKRASITPSSSNNIRDKEVGGIPVDSDYVIFVVDTSGSMQTIWDRVSREILNVLSIHPRVKGFQILNDQGSALISGYSGRFIPDTEQRRRNAMKIFTGWQSASNSSPVEGIMKALKLYVKPGQSTAIYVFGDDYTGSSYDAIIADITKMNRLQEDGRRLAKIHGVGFISRHTTGRFAILMRELTKRNGGTFLALPL